MVYSIYQVRLSRVYKWEDGGGGGGYGFVAVDG